MYTSAYEALFLNNLHKNNLKNLQLFIDTGSLDHRSTISTALLGHYWLANGSNGSFEDYLNQIHFLNGNKLIPNQKHIVNCDLSFSSDSHLVVDFIPDDRPVDINNSVICPKEETISNTDSDSDTEYEHEYDISGKITSIKFLELMIAHIKTSTKSSMICPSDEKQKLVLDNLLAAMKLLMNHSTIDILLGRDTDSTSDSKVEMDTIYDKPGDIAYGEVINYMVPSNRYEVTTNGSVYMPTDTGNPVSLDTGIGRT